jgi:hypothetical protein
VDAFEQFEEELHGAGVVVLRAGQRNREYRRDVEA